MPKSLSMTRCVWMKQLTKKLIQFYQIYQKKSLDSEDFDMKIITFAPTALFISRQFFNYLGKSIPFPNEKKYASKIVKSGTRIHWFPGKDTNLKTISKYFNDNYSKLEVFMRVFL